MIPLASFAAEVATEPRLRALAQAHLGNAHRICGDFRSAEKYLDLAAEFLNSDPLFLEFRASLFENTSKLDQAIHCLRAAGRLRASSGDQEGHAKVLVSTGHVLNEAGRHSEAVQVFASALDSVVADLDLFRAAAHGLAHALSRSGQPFRGLTVLREVAPAFEAADATSRFRISWLLGRIAASCGVDHLAASNLAAARQGFASKGLVQETCLTSLELALHHTRMGRLAFAQELLAGIPELLRELGVDAEADKATTARTLLEWSTPQAIALLDNMIGRIENLGS
jgi:tetratricopeptide (TPR) repeat protein